MRSRGHVRNGPPEAVRMRRASSAGARPATHCNTALCSESTGTISPPPSRAARVTSSPAITRVSLFARATRLPASSAASVASSPAAPTTPFTTMRTSGCVAASTRHSGPWPLPPSPFPALTSPTYAVRDDAPARVRAASHGAFGPLAPPPSPLPRIAQPHIRRLPFGRLAREQLRIGMGRQRDHSEALALACQDVQGGAADRAGGPEDRYADGHATPNRRRNPAAAGKTQ